MRIYDPQSEEWALQNQDVLKSDFSLNESDAYPQFISDHDSDSVLEIGDEKQDENVYNDVNDAIEKETDTAAIEMTSNTGTSE